MGKGERAHGNGDGSRVSREMTLTKELLLHRSGGKDVAQAVLPGVLGQGLVLLNESVLPVQSEEGPRETMSALKKPEVC